MYELMLVGVLDKLELPPDVDEWRRGVAVEVPEAPVPIGVPARDTPLPQCFRSGAPVFADELVAWLRERGADNLQAAATSVAGYSVVNVVGKISIAAFFDQLPAPDRFARRGDVIAAKMREVKSMAGKLAAKAKGLPKPAAAIARLAELNNPLLVRSDIARELKARPTPGAKFDDVRFCSNYIGSGFYQLVADAL